MVRWLNEEGIDLLEVSGGTYEQPRLLGYSGDADTASDGPAMRESTLKAVGAYVKDELSRARRVKKARLISR